MKLLFALIVSGMFWLYSSWFAVELGAWIEARVVFRHRNSLLVARGPALADHCKVAQVVDSPANPAGVSAWWKQFGHRPNALVNLW